MYPPGTIYSIFHIYISPFLYIFATRHIFIINLVCGVSSLSIYKLFITDMGKIDRIEHIRIGAGE